MKRIWKESFALYCLLLWNFRISTLACRGEREQKKGLERATDCQAGHVVVHPISLMMGGFCLDCPGTRGTNEGTEVDEGQAKGDHMRNCLVTWESESSPSGHGTAWWGGNRKAVPALEIGVLKGIPKHVIYSWIINYTMINITVQACHCMSAIIRLWFSHL